jgi:hypothetical protein
MSTSRYGWSAILRVHAPLALALAAGTIAPQITLVRTFEVNDGLIAPDALELRLLVDNLPPGPYFLETKGTPGRYWAVFSPQANPNDPR